MNFFAENHLKIPSKCVKTRPKYVKNASKMHKSVSKMRPKPSHLGKGDRREAVVEEEPCTVSSKYCTNAKRYNALCRIRRDISDIRSAYCSSSVSASPSHLPQRGRFFWGAVQKRGCFRRSSLFIIANYSAISVTTPEPTVRPPSRIAKRRPTSMAMGVISSTFITVLSPGMHISVPSGRVMMPVTSVVRK